MHTPEPMSMRIRTDIIAPIITPIELGGETQQIPGNRHTRPRMPQRLFEKFRLP